MNLITVGACEEPDSQDYDRLYIVIAGNEQEAVDLVRSHTASESRFKAFRVEGVVKGEFGGPAHVTGYCGQGAFTWR